MTEGFSWLRMLRPVQIQNENGKARQREQDGPSELRQSRPLPAGACLATQTGSHRIDSYKPTSFLIEGLTLDDSGRHAPGVLRGDIRAPPVVVGASLTADQGDAQGQGFGVGHFSNIVRSSRWCGPTQYPRIGWPGTAPAIPAPKAPGGAVPGLGRY
jgi:hypothetical protein